MLTYKSHIFIEFLLELKSNVIAGRMRLNTFEKPSVSVFSAIHRCLNCIHFAKRQAYAYKNDKLDIHLRIGVDVSYVN